MKPLVIILKLLCVACGCDYSDKAIYPIEVTSIRNSETQWECNYGKYVIGLDNKFYLITDSLYQVGDTIK